MRDVTDDQANEEFQKYSNNVSESDVTDILSKEEKILKKVKGPLSKFSEDIPLLFSIVKDYTNGSYRELPWKTIAAIVGTLLYVFSPVDLIPDFLLGVGLIDDAAVVGLCMSGLHLDLQQYKFWKNSKKLIKKEDDNHGI
ncbi:MAG: DUF1232 domain-containing protein [Fusobacteriaceae bacterium]|jgi:uncharacterized membrane protein YkvA (DUF1232 family)|nr:DUF1232 domain-containing protein [Fusobacteriaceae bacterium]